MLFCHLAVDAVRLSMQSENGYVRKLGNDGGSLCGGSANQDSKLSLHCLLIRINVGSRMKTRYAALWVAFLAACIGLSVTVAAPLPAGESAGTVSTPSAARDPAI